MRSRRRVTLQPIGMPSRSLNCAIDFFALVITGFWPAISSISAAAGLDLLLVLGRLADAHVDDDLVEPRDLHARSCSRTSRSSPATMRSSYSLRAGAAACLASAIDQLPGLARRRGPSCRPSVSKRTRVGLPSSDRRSRPSTRAAALPCARCRPAGSPASACGGGRRR